MDHSLPAVYILASKPHGVLYTGVTSNLVNRIWQHKEKLVDGFCGQYNVDRLVWYEIHSEIYQAISREKQIKKWRRAWKIELVEAFNPEWVDRFDEIVCPRSDITGYLQDPG